MLCVFNLKAQTSGPAYIKSELTASGVYNAPTFEYTTEFDAYNTSTANGVIKGLFMEGLPYSKSINPENRTKVFCWYGVPNGLAVGEKAPAVILIHGGGGEAYTAWVDEWMDRGYIAIALSLISKLPDGTKETEYAIPPQVSFFSDNEEDLQDQWFYHAVGDVMLAQSLLRSNTFTTQVDTNHIGITGISWGGINATVVTGIDERIDFSIPVYGCAYLKESPVYSNQYSRMSTAAKNFYNANWLGELYTPLHDCPMLFVDSNKDLQFTLNIFGRTYDDSASPEKYLRIENNMGHGHAAGRAPKEIYEFADYITGYNSGVKPLEFTNQTIDNNNNITYDFNYTGDVDEAVLYYTKDTLTWGKNDANFIWHTQTASLVKNSSIGTVTTTLPKQAQAYYINVNNTASSNIFSASLKYNYRTYDWYDFGQNIINTPINGTSGGTLTTDVTNPNTSGINTSTKTNSFVKSSGSNAGLIFELSDKINDISYLKNELKVYLSTALNLVPNNKINLTYYSSALGETKSISVESTISSSGIWAEHNFDFTNETIPTEVTSAGGFDRVKLYFAPDDTITDGTIYYFDALTGTINETFTEPLVFYDWINYSVNPAIVEITKYRDIGGIYIENYDTSLDDIPSPSTNTNKAIKYTKIPGDKTFAQINYNFTDGAIDDNETVTFTVRALFKPETISEINTIEPGCTGISLFLKNNSGDKTQTSQIAYFTATDQWENLSYTFNRDDLYEFDQLFLIFASGYATPKDENGIELPNEDFVYYVESIKSTASFGALNVDDNVSNNQIKAILYPNPASNTFSLSTEIQEGKLFDISGKAVAVFNKNQISYDISMLPNGIYFLKAILKNGAMENVKLIKSGN